MSPYTNPVDSLPSQMLTYRKKVANNKKWAKKCVDACENLGKRQYFDNLRFVENYQMVNGKFMPHHYIDQEGYRDMVSELTRELEVPTTLRHYDIIGKFVNNLTEKLADFPDLFHVREIFEEDETNEYIRTQTDLMHQAVKADINMEIQMRLAQEGIDINKQDFASEEEAMQYKQEIQQMEASMEPHQIQKYMTTSWQSQGEIWGNHQLTRDREYYKLDESERLEFRDMLFTDRCYRHFYLTPEGYEQETWNPINTFIHMSPDVFWTQDGDYVGRIFYLTKSDVVKRYGWRLGKEELRYLKNLDKVDAENNLDFLGYPYKTFAPWGDHKAYDVIRKGTGYDPILNLPLLGDQVLYDITNNLPYVDRAAGLYRCTEVYWMSQRKIGKAIHIDPQTGILTKDIVDENFVLPEHWEEVEGDYTTGDQLNTVYWTWVDEVWKGTKVCFSLNDRDAVYLDMEPCEFQFNDDTNPFKKKLPVCGRIFNNRNAQSMSFVDYLKPNQVGYNLCMNQMYQLCEKEQGKFVIIDPAMLQNIKDWGGEDGLQKFLLVAKELGITMVDTSPSNLKGANSGNQLPREVDMTLTAQIMSRAKLADIFEQKLMSQIGITPQFVGETKATETAEGVKTSVSQTQLTLQKYYTDFFEYKKNCLSMNLDIAQYVQSHEKDIIVNYTKSDQSRVFIKMLGSSLLLRNLNVFVVDSEQLLQQLNDLKKLFMSNNTIGATPVDYAEVIMANSPDAILIKLKESQAKAEQQQQQQQQMQQQQFQANLEKEQEEQNRIDQREHEKNQTELEKARIAADAKTASKQVAPPAQTNNNSQLEYNKFNSRAQAENQRTNIQREGNEIDKEKNTNDKLIRSRQLDLEEKKIDAKNRESRAKIKVSKEVAKRVKRKNQ